MENVPHRTRHVKFGQLATSSAVPVGCFNLVCRAARAYGIVVDPEIKRQLDQTIQEARQALESINVDENSLTEEERGIRAEDTQYKKTFVGFLLSPSMLLDQILPQDVLDQRKKTVVDGQKKAATLSARLGALNILQ